MTKKEQAEFEYLQWFYVECDFGPAHEDVIDIMNEQYMDTQGKPVPEAYRLEEYLIMDACKTVTLNNMTVQENGWVRNSKGRIIARLVDEVDFNSEHLNPEQSKAARDSAIQAIGWVYADCCVTLDNGGDPRQTVMPDVLSRAIKDLDL